MSPFNVKIIVTRIQLVRHRRQRARYRILDVRDGVKHLLRGLPMKILLAICAIGFSIFAGVIFGTSRGAETHQVPPRPRYVGANFSELSPAENAEISFMLGLLDDVRLNQSTYLTTAHLTADEAIARGIETVGDKNAEINLRRMTSAWLADLCEAGLLSSDQVAWLGEVLAQIMFDTLQSPRIRLAVRNRAVEQRLFARPHVALGVAFVDGDRTIHEWRESVKSAATLPTATQPATAPSSQPVAAHDPRRYSGAHFPELTKSQNNDITIVLGTLDDVRLGETKFLDPMGIAPEKAVAQALAILANKQSESNLRRLTSAWLADLCRSRLLDEASERTFSDTLVDILLDRNESPRMRLAARNRAAEQDLLGMPGMRAAMAYADADPAIIQWREQVTATDKDDDVSK